MGTYANSIRSQDNIARDFCAISQGDGCRLNIDIDDLARGLENSRNPFAFLTCRNPL